MEQAADDDLNVEYIGVDELGYVTEVINGVIYVGNRAETAGEGTKATERFVREREERSQLGRHSYVYMDNHPEVDVDEERSERPENGSEENERVEVEDDGVGGGSCGNWGSATEGLFGRIIDGLGQEDAMGQEDGEDDVGEEEAVSGIIAEDVVGEPTVDMHFNSGIEFVAYMHRYAKSKGFGVFIRSSIREVGSVKEKKGDLSVWFNLYNKYRGFRKITMACRKAGCWNSRSKDPNQSTATCKTKCMYLVNANKSRNQSWKITTVCGVHNHSLDPELSKYLPRYQKLSKGDKVIALELYRAGVGMGSAYNVFVNKYKGYEYVPFSLSDLRNYVYFTVQKPLKNRDFVGMEVHFKKIRDLSPDFIYEYEKDVHGVLQNVFWADSRCREAYKDFGDVVSFDTTFLTNRYRMPLAVFVGVNHHGKTMLFGCALMAKETAASFKWVFKQWKKCMGKAPDGILTDQDRAIGSAVASEFPNTVHRWCIWHVKRNCTKHLGRRKDFSAVFKSLEEILHDSFSTEEFEEGWKAWEQQYDLSSVKWVADMFKDRARWAPVYFKCSFWAGMSSTQRSEGANHYLKRFVNVNTSLNAFIENYGNAVAKRIAGEGKDVTVGADRRTKEISRHAFEAVFEKMYSRPKFLEFHDELKEMMSTTATVKEVNGDVVEYDVLVKDFRIGWTRRTNFRVMFDRRRVDARCDCRLFEFRGILCSHVLRVFWEEETLAVPEKYIMRRWRKDITRKYLSDKYPYTALKLKETVEMQRYDEMHRVAEEICVMTMNNPELHKEALEQLKQVHEKMKEKTMEPEGVDSYVIGSVGRVYRSMAKARNGEDAEMDNEFGEAEGEHGSQVKDPIDKMGMGRGTVKRKLSYGEGACSSRGKTGGKKGRKGKRTQESAPPCTPDKDVEGARQPVGQARKTTGNLSSIDGDAISILVPGQPGRWNRCGGTLL